MSFSDIVFPRPEVLKKDGIEGVIDIENLKDKKKKSVESRPEDFFNLTYPTADLKIILENIHQRFNSTERTAGLYLLEGFKGSGKSHLELLVYHLLTSRSIADQWLQKNNLMCKIPDDIVVAIHKFTDFPLDSIWSLVFEKLGYGSSMDPRKVPNLDELRSALSGRKLILILDELEMGIQSIAEPAIQKQNILFLQQLSEESNRTDNASITIFASVYNLNIEPGDTLKRVPGIDIKFNEPLDRQNVVLHRLFSNSQAMDPIKIENVISSFTNHWKKIGVSVDEKYIDRFKKCYPFTPELIDMFLHRVLRQNFQGNRGPLGLLANIVRNMNKKADVITAAHVDIMDKGIRNRLTDLDPGLNILNCAQADLRDLQSLVFASEIVSATLSATITSGGSIRGISDLELNRQVIKPGDDYNVYQATLQALDKLGAYFQHAEGSYFFDIQEKPYAKVEYGALRIDANDAREFSLNRWKINVFGDSNAVIYRDSSQVRAALSQLDKNSLRFVLAPHRLDDAERSFVYHGAEVRNQIVLLEPKSDSFNALDNPDLVKWAQLAKSAFELVNTAADSERKKQYEKIGNENIHYIDDAFRKAGIYYVLIHASINGEQTLEYELEPIGSATNRNDVLMQLQQNVFPRQRFEDHILECLQDDKRKQIIVDRTVGEIKAIYKKTLGFPVFTAETIIARAFAQLCKDKRIGLRNARSRHCGSTPSYLDSEWNDVLVVESFVEECDAASFPFDNPPADSMHSEMIKEEDSEIQNAQTAGPMVNEFTIQTTNERSINSLRQKMAEKLSEKNEPLCRWVRFTVFIQQPNTELSVFPAALRGALTGFANLNVEILIEKNGNFNKAQIEQMVEQLPSFSQALYKAEARGTSKIEESQNK